MSKRTLTDLRDHLFKTIERLKDDKNPMEVSRAQAVAAVAKTILDSAKVEIGYMRVTDAYVESGFIGAPGNPRIQSKTPAALPESAGSAEPKLLRCLECGEQFDQAGFDDHNRRVRQTGRHTRKPEVRSA